MLSHIASHRIVIGEERQSRKLCIGGEILPLEIIGPDFEDTLLGHLSISIPMNQASSCHNMFKLPSLAYPGVQSIFLGVWTDLEKLCKRAVI